MTKEKGYTQRYLDYSAGRKNALSLTVIIGARGSAKSELVKFWVKQGRGRVASVSRDELHSMMLFDLPQTARTEEVTRLTELTCIKNFLRQGTNVIVDDDHISVVQWEELAKDWKLKLRIVTMKTARV
jgi:hypothetical protein